MLGLAMLLQANSLSVIPRDRLEKLFNDSLKKLKAKDKELAIMLAERDSLAAQQTERQPEEQGKMQEMAAVLDSLKAEAEVGFLTWGKTSARREYATYCSPAAEAPQEIWFVACRLNQSSRTLLGMR